MPTKEFHSDPFGAAFTTLAGQVAALVVEQLQRGGGPSPIADAVSQIAASGLGTTLDLWKPYTAKEVGEFLGLSDKAVYNIPDDQLAPVYRGPSGTRKRYLGINVLMYTLGLEPVDTESIGRSVRERFIRQAEQPVAVRAAKGLTGKQRVL